MNIQTVKTVVRLAASLGAGTIVGSVARNNVTSTDILTRITVPVGAFALGGIAGDHSAQFTDRFIDQIVDVVKNAKDAQPTT